MDIKLSIPNDIAEFLANNPKAGRMVIASEFGMGDMEARVYAAINRMIHDKGKEGTKANEILKKCKMDINVKEAIGDKDGTASGKVVVPGDLVDRDSVVQGFLEETGLNNDKWIIKDIQCKRWNTGMKIKEYVGDSGRGFPIYNYDIEYAIQWSISVKFARNPKKALFDATRALIKKMEPLAKFTPTTFSAYDQNIRGEVMMSDVHIGKAAWNHETLLGDMDLKIIEKVSDEACDKILNDVARFNPSMIYIPIGNDFVHSENQQGVTTKAGHVLDVDNRYPKVIEIAERVAIKMVDKAAQIAPVKGFWLPGNHDYHASHTISRILRQRYLNNKHVEIEIGGSQRKADRFGKTFVCWTHDHVGAKGKRIVDNLRVWFPELYAGAKYIELHVGHIHKHNVTKYEPVVTAGGVVVRQSASLSASDAWHFDFAFTDGIPGCEGGIITADAGIKAWFTEYIDYHRFKK